MRYSPSPLRYPGGKGRISGYFAKIVQCNDLAGGDYAEPYAGGAGVALSLLLTGHVRHIHVNDLNYPLYCFWHSVLHETEGLCKKIQRSTISIEAWKRHRNKIKNHSDHSKLEVGFAFMFLNRTNRSGIINGGVIGGYAQEGSWRMDCRFNKSSLIEKIRGIERLKDNISLYNLDAKDFISDIASSLPRKSLVYIDPPYFKKGQRLYDNYYCSTDHAEIAKVIKKLKRNWIVSYDNVPEIKANYEEFRKLEYELNYSAGNKYMGNELMVYGNNLIIPKPNNPLMEKAAPPLIIQ